MDMEINLVPKFLDEALTPMAQSVGSTLSSVWTMVFGGIDLYSEKINLKRASNLNKFKEDLEQRVSSVPVQNLVEPPLHIIGPTLEASKFYFENDQLRVMFANLIAASINSEFIDKTHPSFVEIIKQLSPLDAQNLLLFKDKSTHPVAEYRIPVGKGYRKYLTNVFLGNKQVSNLFLVSVSISNLERLGLVDVTYGDKYINESVFDQFYSTDIYNNYQQILTTITPLGSQSEVLPDKKFIVKKGLVSLTPFGKNFVRVCL